MRFLALSLLLVACKSQSTTEQGKVASCNLTTANNCREYGAANLAAGSDHLAKLCAIASSATFAMTPCPTANVIGRCAQQEHTDVYYTGYPIPADELVTSCNTSGGRFSKAP